MVALPLLRGLTTRSTGPIAAGRHLGYKSLAQIPAHRNGPVNSNVRPPVHTQPKFKGSMQPSPSFAVPNVAFSAYLWFVERVALRSLFSIFRSFFPPAPVRQRIKRFRLGRACAAAWPNHSLNRTHCGGLAFGL